MFVKSLYEVNYYGYVYIVSEMLVYTARNLYLNRGGTHKIKVVLPNNMVCMALGNNGSVHSFESMQQIILPKSEPGQPKVKYRLVFLPILDVVQQNKGKCRVDYTVNCITNPEVYNNMEESFPEKK